VKEYVPSGSDASSANFKCSYKFYELMRPLDDVLETTSYVILQIKFKYLNILMLL